MSAGRATPASARQAGFTLVGALILAGLMGTGIMAYGELASQAVQREKETELLFRGHQYRQAIESYYRHAQTYPKSLEELLQDSRHPHTVRHLRRPYPDPITGTADWGLMEAPEGGIMGVYSRSEAKPLKSGNFVPPDAAFAKAERYSDWQFFYRSEAR